MSGRWSPDAERDINLLVAAGAPGDDRVLKLAGPESERLPTLEAVDSEVGMIERENIVEAPLFGKNHQGGIR